MELGWQNTESVALFNMQPVQVSNILRKHTQHGVACMEYSAPDDMKYFSSPSFKLWYLTCMIWIRTVRASFCVLFSWSTLLEMRCQVHSELAVIEEEEGCLEASLTHLQKAMQLDNGSLREGLSSALHLLQLRRALYHTPSRVEDKAAMLLQQVSSPVSDSVTLRTVTMLWIFLHTQLQW